MNKIAFVISLTLLIFGVEKLQAQEINNTYIDTEEKRNTYEHLEPVKGIFDLYPYQTEYYTIVGKVLFEGLTESPNLRLLVMPSFSPENVLDIVNDYETKKHYIYFHKCEKIIWYSKDKENVKVAKFKKEISSSSVDLLKLLFKTVIFQTKYVDTNLITGDGVKYYFTISDNGQKSGMTHSPHEGTKMHKLVDIGNGLIEFAQNDKSELNLDLIKKIKNLINDLK